MGFFRDIFWVGAGGFLGSVGRHLVAVTILRLWPAAAFPWATVLVNVVGSGVLGMLAGWHLLRDPFRPEVRLFLFVGVLGGFTTFSTFSQETVTLLRDGQSARAWANVALQLGSGLLAAAAGFAWVRSQQ